jgi:hypothetical protein
MPVVQSGSEKVSWLDHLYYAFKLVKQVLGSKRMFVQYYDLLLWAIIQKVNRVCTLYRPGCNMKCTASVSRFRRQKSWSAFADSVAVNDEAVVSKGLGSKRCVGSPDVTIFTIHDSYSWNLSRLFAVLISDFYLMNLLESGRLLWLIVA